MIAVKDDRLQHLVARVLQGLCGRCCCGRRINSDLAEEIGGQIVERNRSCCSDLLRQPVVELGKIGSGYRPGVVTDLRISVTVVHVPRIAPKQGTYAALLIGPVDW